MRLRGASMCVHAPRDADRDPVHTQAAQHQQLLELRQALVVAHGQRRLLRRLKLIVLAPHALLALDVVGQAREGVHAAVWAQLGLAQLHKADQVLPALVGEPVVRPLCAWQGRELAQLSTSTLNFVG